MNTKRTATGLSSLLCLLLLLSWNPARVSAAAAASTHESQGTPAEPTASARPAFSFRLDGSLLLADLVGGVAAPRISIDRQEVPLGGLNRSSIRLSLDRHAVENQNGRASSASNWTVAACVALPFAVSSLTSHGSARLSAPLYRLTSYLEASMLCDALTGGLKRGVSRPRPYLYRSRGRDPEAGLRSDVPGGAFLSFPSGHSSTAWCAASFAIVDHMRSRPEASWEENAAVGFLGGLLAGSTSTLRVQAGVHFPTDVAAGALLGTACGAGIPLAHRYVRGGARAPLPDRKDWAASLAGTGAGLLVSILAASALYPD